MLEMLYARAKLGQPAERGDVEGAIEEARFRAPCSPATSTGPRDAFAQIKTRRRGVVRARNAAQDRYLAALRKHELVFAEGPAGTGKTWLAVGHAVSLLEQGLVERLILSRPAVEAGERLGFLPGDMRDKVDPYLRPIYDALYDFMDGRMVERGIADRHDRDRAARLHARAHARQGRGPARRGAERHRDADEDVPDPPRRGVAHDRQRRSDPDRSAAGPEVRA